MGMKQTTCEYEKFPPSGLETNVCFLLSSFSLASSLYSPPPDPTRCSEVRSTVHHQAGRGTSRTKPDRGRSRCNPKQKCKEEKEDYGRAKRRDWSPKWWPSKEHPPPQRFPLEVIALGILSCPSPPQYHEPSTRGVSGVGPGQQPASLFHRGMRRDIGPSLPQGSELLTPTGTPFKRLNSWVIGNMCHLFFILFFFPRWSCSGVSLL